MKLLMKFDGTYLIPSAENSVREYEKIKRGQEYMVEIMRARNPKFHRLAFALINAMFDNQERFENYEDFRRELKIMTGHYDEYLTSKGQTVFIPKSWAFSKMDDIEFSDVYSKIADIAVKRFGHEFLAQIEHRATA